MLDLKSERTRDVPQLLRGFSDECTIVLRNDLVIQRKLHNIATLREPDLYIIVTFPRVQDY